jgi:hypothetical protein
MVQDLKLESSKHKKIELLFKVLSYNIERAIRIALKLINYLISISTEPIYSDKFIYLELSNLVMKRKQSKESKTTKYYVRAIKRISAVALWLFILFCLVMFIIWAVPKVWHWALG